MNDGLIAYYPFDENANDESSNGNDGTVNGATLTEDRFGNADSAYAFKNANLIAALSEVAVPKKNQQLLLLIFTYKG